MSKSPVTLPFRFVRGLFRLATNGPFLIAAALLLALNAATLTVPSMNSAASRLFHSVTGVRTLAQENQATLRSVQGEVEALASRTAEMSDQLTRLQAERAAQETQMAELRKAAVTTATSIAQRTTRLDGLRGDTLAGRSVPLWGMSLAQATDTIEHQAACDTLTDIAALRAVLNPKASVAADPALCTISVPSADALWMQVKSNPRLTWESARDRLLAYGGPAPKFPRPEFQSWWGATLATMERWF